MSENVKEAQSPVGINHLRVNVADKDATARWYVDTLELEIIPSSNPDVVCVADKDHYFYLEFSSIPGIRTTYSDIHLDAFHIAFEGGKNIEEIGERMLANGATQEGEIFRNLIGDYVLNSRDPNGLSVQLIRRINNFYPKAVKAPLRFEHVGLNVANQMIASLWLIEFVDMTIPWSKDIDTKANNFRNYRVPYVGDKAGKMSIELYDKKGVDYSYASFKHEEAHIAFSSDEPERLAKQMVYGGAQQLSPMRTEPNGDQVIDLVDPRNFPFRLVKQKTAVLK